MKLYYKYLLTNLYKMESIQGVISDLHGVDPTGTYHADSDFRLIKCPFNYSKKIH